MTDKSGHLVQGLSKSAFIIYDNDVPQEITYFDAQQEPASIGVVFDASRPSFEHQNRGKKLGRAGLEVFMKTGHQLNDYFLVSFSNRPQLLIDWTGAGETVLEKIESLRIEGKTPFHDACYLALEKLMHGAHRKRVLLFIGDGEDTNSKHQFQELRQFLKQTDVLFYALNTAMDEHIRMTRLSSTPGMPFLDRLASASGGQVYSPINTKEAIIALEHLGQQLSAQYTIGFRPVGRRSDNKQHHIRVEVTAPPQASSKILPLKARTREDY